MKRPLISTTASLKPFRGEEKYESNFLLERWTENFHSQMRKKGLNTKRVKSRQISKFYIFFKLLYTKTHNYIRILIILRFHLITYLVNFAHFSSVSSPSREDYSEFSRDALRELYLKVTSVIDKNLSTTHFDFFFTTPRKKWNEQEKS